MTRTREACPRVVALFLAVFGICHAALADPLFNPQVPYGVGDGPGSVALGDLDEDTDLDLAVANELTDDVSILLGNGDGTFQTAVDYAAGTEPSSVAVGYLNGDGYLDLAVANEGSNNVSVLLGNGDGTFQTHADHTVGVSPSSVVVADLNSDNKLDLAVANWNDNDVSVLLGNGNGTFQAPVDYAVGNKPSSLAAGDLNGDDAPDLVAANQYSSSVSVLLGNGNGTFQSAVNYGLDAYSYPSSVAVGDLNKDNNPDLVVTKEVTHDVSVLLGNGNGTFQADVDYAAGSAPFSVAIEDLDVDDNPDLAVADWSNTGKVWVLLGNGDGTFQAADDYAAQSKAISVAVGDLDGDVTPDLAVANYGSDSVSIFINMKETCNDSDGDGFGSPASPSCGYPEEDCDNGNPDINPYADDLCNGQDDDCNPATADGADEVWLGAPCDGPDTDFCKEGIYSCEGASQICSDHTNNNVEVCDGLDNDCDLTIPSSETDDDSDQYVECQVWVGSIPTIKGGKDCNDANPAMHPGGTEIQCNGVDEDCSGSDYCPAPCTESAEASSALPGPVDGSAAGGRYLVCFLLPAGVALLSRVRPWTK